MVYIQSWQQFQEAAEALYDKAPTTTRYCVKWRASEGKLVLKITDNTTCLKFKTHSSLYLNRFEALNLSLMQRMQNRRPQQASAGPVKAEAPEPSTKGIPAPAAAVDTTGAAGGGGGVKKKKPKKKK
ncbi:signal recognition particle, SRP9/SRP14 subunit [Laetiporus sulphureus 93-53]|uniref:Signal recognition particle, SRP9/SRP14 subunit n=1 Tax=Laetiporus sulphureus 93-53 TaxID=1314785 RepID=A0A165B6Y6_9APHY|nr:signal recognition particle, SRP9/SRP14 subunit [Laetiporus sulphureus 93-53]KZT00386.1 signal recognition particle, SRP9/SRP14 subunit [Laetiporus sulphureus 93-53]